MLPEKVLRSTITLRHPGVSHSYAGKRLRRQLPALLVLSAGLLVTAWVAYEEQTTAVEEESYAFGRKADALSSDIALAFSRPLELLHASAALLDAFPALTAAEFQRFAEQLAQGHPELSAVHWLPRVLADERSTFEQEQGVELREQATPDRTRRARARPLYLPVLFLAGWEPPALRGVDRLGVSGDNALLKARATGRPVATVLRRAGEPPVLSLVQAVYHGQPQDAEDRATRFQGLVELWLHVEPTLRPALEGTRAEALDVALYDLSGPRGQHLVYQSGTPGSDGDDPAEGSYGSDLFIADRWFRVVVTPSELSAPSQVLATLGIGSLLSLLVASLLSAAIALRHLHVRVAEAGKLGQYVLETEIGRGSMGVVYRATHNLLRRPTALKLLPAEQLTPEALRRFEREVQITAGLSHPNTIAIYDYGHTEDDIFYYAMEYLEGIDLQQLVMAEGRQPQERVAHLLLQACGALEEAHAAGLVHRDIKPANLLLCMRGGVPDFLKVLDFGLVKDLRTSDQLQQSAFVGTPLYAAPEAVLAPERQDGRADLYSLGAVAFFLLTGREVFRGARVIDVLEQHRVAQPPPLCELGIDDVSAELEALVRACLAKRPEDRPASARCLRERIEQTGLAAAWTRERAQRFWHVRGPALLRARQDAAAHTAVSLEDIGFGQTLIAPARSRSWRSARAGL